MPDEYESWLAAALGETERRARRSMPCHAAAWRGASERAPHERAALVLDRVVAALAAEARIEAIIDAAACEAWLAAGRGRDDAGRG